jgi:hypothetical protein
MIPEEEARLLRRVEDALRSSDVDPLSVEEPDDKTEWIGFVALLVWTVVVGGGAFFAGAAWRGSQIVGG